MQGITGASLRSLSLTRATTTLLCCVWAYTFAYSFFQSVLERSSPLVMLAATLPIAAVWAALERKRWGRLVLMAQSVLAHLLFGIMVVFLACSRERVAGPVDHNLFGYINYALQLFGETPETTLSILLLAALTAVWLSMPCVRDDFESQKKAFLSPGQQIIAAAVIGMWGLTMATSPTVQETRMPNLPFKTPRRVTMRY